MKSLLGIVALGLALAFAGARAAEVIPPPPANHFNDYAGIVRRATAAQLDQELTQFERDTSNQLVVAIYPKMQSDSSVEDYTVRVAQRWGVGQKDRKNGAVLFVFQQSHDIRIQTGYGLEGALPDALCKQIIENEIAPRFRNGDFDGGLTAGVHAMMAAARGEYRGTGKTVAQTRGVNAAGGVSTGTIIFFVVLFIVMRVLMARARRGVVYGPRGGRIWTGSGPWIIGGGGGGWGGGGSSGGSFMGGGGSFGGGGAGGKW